MTRPSSSPFSTASTPRAGSSMPLYLMTKVSFSFWLHFSFEDDNMYIVVDAYQSWDLFLIFVSIVVLIGGVVLLTNKKPEKMQQQQGPGTTLAVLPARPRSKDKDAKGGGGGSGSEAEALRLAEPGEDEVVWQLGEDSDEEDRGDGYAQEGSARPRARRRDTHGE